MSTQRYIATFIFLIVYGIGLAQPASQEPRTLSEMPKVFLIGEYENLYADLYREYSGIILNQTDNNMEEAFKKWLHMLYAMEKHSEQIDYDLKGLKVWFHVFFNQAGKIDYLMFFKKPMSKNINDLELIAFFRSFIRDFQLPIEAVENFNHSGSGSFPTYGYTPMEARKGDDH